MDCIRINNLEVFGNHGVYKEENKLGQKFSVSAELYVNTRNAGLNDNLDLSVNYGEVCNHIYDFMKNKTYKLIEAVAENLAKDILISFDKLEGIKLEIKKPWAPIGLHLDEVSVVVERMWHTAYIALGSNMGNKEEYIKHAVNSLDSYEEIKVVRVSELIKTEPYGYTEQDEFLNGVMCVKTLLSPDELLDRLHEIEKECDRERTIHWGPRTLDLDIIFYDDVVLCTEKLIIPHADMENRDFVLRPLNEIAPYLIHPVNHKTVNQMLKELNQ